jgi:hypothetical protein
VGYGAFLFAALTILVFIVLSLLLGPEADANAGAVAFLIGVPLTLLILGALLVGTVASISGRVPRPLQCLGGAAVVYVGIMVTELISASIVTPLFLLPTLGLSVDWFLRGRKRLVDH